MENLQSFEEFINESYGIEEKSMTRANESVVTEAKVMSKAAIDKLVKELVADGRHGDDAAFDIADGILYDEEGLAAGIKKHFNASDAQGWLANRIA